MSTDKGLNFAAPGDVTMNGYSCATSSLDGRFLAQILPAGPCTFLHVVRASDGSSVHAEHIDARYAQSFLVALRAFLDAGGLADVAPTLMALPRRHTGEEIRRTMVEENQKSRVAMLFSAMGYAENGEPVAAGILQQMADGYRKLASLSALLADHLDGMLPAARPMGGNAK